MTKRPLLTWLAVLSGLVGPVAHAQGRPPDPVPSDVVSPQPAEVVSLQPSLAFHGLVSQGFMWSTDNNYLTRSSEGSFEFTEAALNVTAQLTPELRAGMQLFARDLGPIGAYSAKFDWFYLDYRFADWLGIRAGRTKIPFGLYNETADIDSAFVPVLLPQSVYPTTNRDYLLAQTGGEVYGYIDLCDAGALEYRLYGGTIYIDPPRNNGTFPRITDVEVPYVVGARLIWETPLSGLRVGATLQSLNLDLGYQLAEDARLALDFDVDIWLLSAEFTTGDLVLALEYSRWNASLHADNPAVLPDAKVDNERYYISAAHRVAPWLEVGLYYAGYTPNVEKRKGRANYQHDVALTLRFDATTFWTIKLEGHLIRGTAGLDPALNGGKPLSELEDLWGLFLVKTTAAF